MYYQIMSWDSYREEVQDTAADWNDGRDELTADDVLHDLLGCLKNIDPTWGVEFESADELERIDGFRRKTLYTQNESEAYRARDKYFDEALYSVFSMQEMAEAIVETFNEIKEKEQV